MIHEGLADAANHVVGVKQVIRALEEGRVTRAYIAKDADLTLTQRIVDRCYARNIPCEEIESMEKLGRLCEIDVKAAAAALLRA